VNGTFAYASGVPDAAAEPYTRIVYVPVAVGALTVTEQLGFIAQPAGSGAVCMPSAEPVDDANANVADLPATGTFAVNVACSVAFPGNGVADPPGEGEADGAALGFAVAEGAALGVGGVADPPLPPPHALTVPRAHAANRAETRNFGILPLSYGIDHPRAMSAWARTPVRAGARECFSRASRMEFGIQFFPAVGPDEVDAEQYFANALRLIERAEPLGFAHARIVEPYFRPYGGYSPNPLLFLSAVSQRTTQMRLITGAVLPVFNHPLKLAGEIGMLDAISHGRLEVGFARAFLPHEFARFGISLDESRDRFDEGLAIVGRLLEEENVAFEGRFHQFGPTTSLPRPTQKPRPPFWIAALATEQSFVNAGRLGHSVMAIPILHAELRRLIGVYRDAWREAGHPGNGRVMLAFHMFCHEDAGEAVRIARGPLNGYLRSLADAAGDWTTGTSSKDYPGYDKMIAKLRDDSFESNVSMGSAWIGTPDQVAGQIRQYVAEVGDFEIASLQVNFGTIPYAEAKKSIELFAREVMPEFTRSLAAS
jgi:alkanesulfonate monooxygenase SsuD/methylene tetrahydromethanopterin reductase-like flavin-dependent oxidoreductase (luciferase family)